VPILRFVRVCALTTAAFAGATLPSLAGGNWSADTSQSNVTLSVSQLLFAKVSGSIPIASATIVATDGATPSVIDVVLDSARLDTHDPQRDAQMRGDKFFDVNAFPTIAFASETITATGQRRFSIDGTLTMRGVTHPLHLDAYSDGVQAGLGGERSVRYEARGSFHRSDYGMTYLRGIVGNDVSLDIVLEAREPG
jgi:polyisoprenoid-binding protein YceI